MGSAGTGKSSIAAQFVCAAGERGEKSAMFLFDEGRNTLLTRMSGLGVDLQKHYAAGQVSIRQVDPAELTPGEFANSIRVAVEQDGIRVLVIDSLNGYLNAMPGERYLSIHLHELLTYLGDKGVATIVIGAHQGMIGSQMVTPVDASYLADAVVLMRYYEDRGEVKQAISVMKKRGGSHERTIRRFMMTSQGMQIGEPLREYRGVFTGVPVIDPLERAPDGGS
jgi:circadian clock protein KaiC